MSENRFWLCRHGGKKRKERFSGGNCGKMVVFASERWFSGKKNLKFYFGVGFVGV